MIPLRVSEIAEAVGGRLEGVHPETVATGPVVVDSRLAGPGGLFVALAGERVDGHDFAAEAHARGVAAVLCSRPIPDVPCIVAAPVDGPVGGPVDGPLEAALVAFGRLARHVTDRLDRTTVVAVTGSQGKTTAKDLIKHVLADLGPTIAPEASLNNELGVPLTALRADADTRYLVLEMGARGAGHIRYLTEIVAPDVGVVLNVGLSHVGEFGSQDAIAQAKGELVEALPGGPGTAALAVLNADDARVVAMAARTRAATTTFGRSAAAEVRADDVTVDGTGRAEFRLVTPEGSARVHLRLVGEHHVTNALAAAAVGRHAGLDVDRLAARLSTAEQRARWRMEVRERSDGVTVVNDAYNASPDSVRAALQTLVTLGRARTPARRTWAVLGEMLELGAASRAEHEALGTLAVRLGVSRLVVVGEGARPAEAAASRAGARGEESVFVPDADGALALLRRELAPGDIVLVKSSRDAGLRHLGDTLVEDGLAGGADVRPVHGEVGA